jgi:hypothetical protein
VLHGPSIPLLRLDGSAVGEELYRLSVQGAEIEFADGAGRRSVKDKAAERLHGRDGRSRVASGERVDHHGGGQFCRGIRQVGRGGDQPAIDAELREEIGLLLAGGLPPNHCATTLRQLDGQRAHSAAGSQYQDTIIRGDLRDLCDQHPCGASGCADRHCLGRIDGWRKRENRIRGNRCPLAIQPIPARPESSPPNQHRSAIDFARRLRPRDEGKRLLPTRHRALRDPHVERVDPDGPRLEQDFALDGLWLGKVFHFEWSAEPMEPDRPHRGQPTFQ